MKSPERAHRAVVIEHARAINSRAIAILGACKGKSPELDEVDVQLRAIERHAGRLRWHCEERKRKGTE